MASRRSPAAAAALMTTSLGGRAAAARRAAAPLLGRSRRYSTQLAVELEPEHEMMRQTCRDFAQHFGLSRLLQLCADLGE